VYILGYTTLRGTYKPLKREAHFSEKRGSHPSEKRGSHPSEKRGNLCAKSLSSLG